MKTIKVKKGLDLKVSGAPAGTIQNGSPPTHLALLPEHIPFVKPRLKISEGDQVQVGTPLIEDKRNTQIQFLSPGGGEVSKIRFGPRRVIQEIVIELEADENAVQFERFTRQDLDRVSRAHVVGALISGGLWPLFKELPFRDYPHPDATPPALFVSLDNLEPFHPSATAYLSGNEALFQYGLSVLDKIAQAPVYVCRHRDRHGTAAALNGFVDLTYTGSYPAHDPGVLLYHLKKTSRENRAWFINGQDVIAIARLLKFGTYPTERVVALGGSGVIDPRHVITRNGAPFAAIVPDRPTTPGLRFIQNGVLTGFGTSPGSFLGYSVSALNLLPEGNQKGELLDLFNPGFRKPTYSRAFLSALNADDLTYDCRMNGGERACIACGYCARVCPVDILPQFTYKAILAGEVEESAEHGLLDCVECGLCSFVCPSKIELTEALKTAKAAFYREQVSQ